MEEEQEQERREVLFSWSFQGLVCSRQVRVTGHSLRRPEGWTIWSEVSPRHRAILVVKFAGSRRAGTGHAASQVLKKKIIFRRLDQAISIYKRTFARYLATGHHADRATVVPRSLPAGAANWLTAIARFAWAMPVGNTDCPRCRPIGSTRSVFDLRRTDDTRCERF